MPKPDSTKHSARPHEAVKDLVEILPDRGPPVNKGLEFWAVLHSLGGAIADFEVLDAGLAEGPAQNMWRLSLGGTKNSMTDGDSTL
jgi:hypothetical protein